MQPTVRLITLAGLLVAAFATGCAGPNVVPGGTQYLGGLVGPIHTGNDFQDSVSYWDGGGADGPPSIAINLNEQKAYFYKGDELVGVSRISTGREGFGTPSGNYKIMEKDIDHKSNLYGSFVDDAGNVIDNDADLKTEKPPPGTHFEGAPMNYFMRVTGAIGMHAGYLPGYAASHGCIRLPEKMAKKFYEHASPGTPVRIEL